MGAALDEIQSKLTGLVKTRSKFHVALIICAAAFTLVILLAESNAFSPGEAGRFSLRQGLLIGAALLILLGIDLGASFFFFRPLEAILRQTLLLEEKTTPSKTAVSGNFPPPISAAADQITRPITGNPLTIFPFQDLYELLRLNKASSPLQLFTRIMDNLPYTCVLFDVGEDVLRLNYFHDTGRRAMDTAMRGLALPFIDGENILSAKSLLLSDELQDNAAFESLFSFVKNRDIHRFGIFTISVNGASAHIFVVSLDQAANDSYALPLLKTTAEVFSASLQRRIEQTKISHQLESLNSLAELSQAISAEFDLSRLYHLVYKKVTDPLGKDFSFYIAVYDKNRLEITVPFIAEGETISSIDAFPIGNGLTSVLLETRKPLLLVNNVEAEGQRLGAKVVGSPAKSWLGVPLLYNGEAIGAMVVQDTHHDHRFGEKDQAYLQTLAPQVAIALRNAQLVDEMTQAINAYGREKLLLNELLDNIPEKIYFKDENGVYIRASNSFLTANGYTDESEVVGHTDAELLPGSAGRAMHLDDLFVIQTVKASLGEIIEHTADNGQSSWDMVTRIPLIVGENTTGLLGIAQDITSLKLAEIQSSRQAERLFTASQIARDVTGSLELKDILANAVNLICMQFNYDHCGIFLLDQVQKQAVLAEAYGDAGKKMLQSGYRLAVGSQSLVGQATAKNQTAVANQVKNQPDYFANPFLPETMSEVVIPLNIGERVLGALDVQSNHESAFTFDDLHALEILADQLAMAIENSRLFTRTQDNLAKHRLLHEITTTASQTQSFEQSLQVIVEMLNQALKTDWAAIFSNQPDHNLEILAFTGSLNPNDEQSNWLRDSSIVKSCFREGKPVANKLLSVSAKGEFLEEYAFPIHYSGEILAVLHIGALNTNFMDENDYEIIGALANTVGGIMTTSRLIDQIRIQALRQKQLFEVSSKIRRFVDIESILRTSAEEIGKTLQVRSAKVKITTALPETDNELADRRLIRDENGDAKL